MCYTGLRLPLDSHDLDIVMAQCCQQENKRSNRAKRSKLIDRVCGLEISVLAFYSEIRVRISLKSTVFPVKSCLKRMKINKKEAGDGPFLKKIQTSKRRVDEAAI